MGPMPISNVPSSMGPLPLSIVPSSMGPLTCNKVIGEIISETGHGGGGNRVAQGVKDAKKEKKITSSMAAVTFRLGQELTIGGHRCTIIQEIKKKGGFGEVCTAQRVEDSFIFGIKCPRADSKGFVSGESIEQAKAEILRLQALSGCAFIVKMIARRVNDDYVRLKIVQCCLGYLFEH